MSPENPRDRLRREARRLHQRYLTEVVERFSICPWAKAARLHDRMRTHVVTDRCSAVDTLRPVIEDWAGDDRVEVAFVIVPLFAGTREAFASWASTVASLREDVFLSAPFHPAPEARTIPFLRRTPDPTLQLVRRARLDVVRAHDPPHYQDIFALDLSALERRGSAKTVAASVLAHNERLLAEDRPRLEAILEAIHQDRDATYGDMIPV
mgnify:CR=1 FL=1